MGRSDIDEWSDGGGRASTTRTWVLVVAVLVLVPFAFGSFAGLGQWWPVVVATAAFFGLVGLGFWAAQRWMLTRSADDRSGAGGATWSDRR